MPRLLRIPTVALAAWLPTLAACQHHPTQPAPRASVQIDPDPALPQTIEFDPGFRGSPLRTTELSADITLEIFADGKGPRATPGKRVSFLFSGYDAATGDRVMGTDEWPAKLVIGARATEPLTVTMQEVLTGLQVGAQVRVHLPAMLANAGRAERESHIGELWITLTVTDVDEPRPPTELDAFAGAPLASEARHDGLEIHDYARGEGLPASDGDRVEFHYVITSTAGETLLSTHADASPVELTLGANSGVPGLAKGLRGAQSGTLRKLVIPAQLGFDEWAPEQFPRGVPLVIYVEVTRVDPGPEREI